MFTWWRLRLDTCARSWQDIPMTDTMNHLPIRPFRPEALALIEVLLMAVYSANSLGSYHERQTGGTFGAVYDALKKAIWCELRVTGHLTWTPDDLTQIAKVLVSEAIENGENIVYQIDLWNRNLIGPDTH